MERVIFTTCCIALQCRTAKGCDTTGDTIMQIPSLRAAFAAVVLCLAILNGCSPALAQGLPPEPRLRVVLGNEHFPGLPGLTGLSPHGADFRSMTVLVPGEGERLLTFNVEVLNAGQEPWSPWREVKQGDTSQVYWDGWGLAVRGFYYFSLTDESGRVLAERLQDADWCIWDGVTLVPGLPQYFGWYMPGISPGCAAVPADPYWAGQFLDLRGIEDQILTLTVAVDPLNVWGQFHQQSVKFLLQGYQVNFVQ